MPLWESSVSCDGLCDKYGGDIVEYCENIETKRVEQHHEMTDNQVVFIYKHYFSHADEAAHIKGTHDEGTIKD